MNKEGFDRRMIAQLPLIPLIPSGNLFGYMSRMKTDPLGVAMMALSHSQRIARVRVGPVSMCFVFDPADIRRVLMDDNDVYQKTTRAYEKLRRLVGNGLLTSSGDFWLRQRRIAQPAFRRRCIEGFADTMVSHTKALCDRWRRDVGRDGPVDVADAMNLLTLRIAGETLMSADMEAEGREVGEVMSYLMERFNGLVGSPLPYPELWPTPANVKLWRAVKTLHGMTDRLIAERRSSGAQVPDLLGMFMAAEDPDSGTQMDDRQLRDEVLTMLLAGHETTANGLTWMLYLLGQHPEVTIRLEEEVDRVLGGRTVSVSDIKEHTYTTQVIKESLRLFPPVWTVVRQASMDTELGGYKVSKGSYMFVSQYVMHRHPDHWSNPEAFDPDRFGPDKDDIDRFVYFPFLRGRRQCIGDRFAEMELTLVLATLVQAFRFELVPGHPVELEPSVTLRPKPGMRMNVTSRSYPVK